MNIADLTVKAAQEATDTGVPIEQILDRMAREHQDDRKVSLADALAVIEGAELTDEQREGILCRLGQCTVQEEEPAPLTGKDYLLQQLEQGTEALKALPIYDRLEQVEIARLREGIENGTVRSAEVDRFIHKWSQHVQEDTEPQTGQQKFEEAKRILLSQGKTELAAKLHRADFQDDSQADFGNAMARQRREDQQTVRAHATYGYALWPGDPGYDQARPWPMGKTVPIRHR